MSRAGLRGRRAALLVAAFVAAAFGLVASTTDALPRLENDTVSLRFEVRGPRTASDVAVVAVDDRTFDELGVPWPLPRRLHARAIDRLREAGARVIVYDVQFTEPTNPRDDLALYDAVARARGVVLATSETDANGRTKILGGDENLRAAAALPAAANLRGGAGGEIHRFERDVSRLGTLPVVAAERATGRTLSPDVFGEDGARIDFAGPTGTVPTYSFSDLIARKPDPALLGKLRDKVVVVGASAPSLQDVHPTPMDHDRLMPGPEIQANAIQTAMDGIPLRDAPPRATWLAIVVLAALPVLASLRMRVIAVALAAPLMGAAYLAVAQVAFDAGRVLDVAHPLIALVAGTVAMAVAHHLLEQRERRRVSLENDVLEQRVRERTRELHETQVELVRRLANAAESRDGDTGAHIERMSAMCERLAIELGYTPEEAERLRLAAALHDIGKLSVPDRVLHKPGKLDAEEWDIMRSHTTWGADILTGSKTPLVRLAEDIARSHHERWDGKGYPAGLIGEEIPQAARISAVCDVFDALVSRRAYKEAWSVEDAIQAILRDRGTHFDPAVVDAFERLAPALRVEHADEPALAAAA